MSEAQFLALVAAFWWGGVVLTVWRGWFPFPLGVRLSRSENPVFFWLVTAFVGAGGVLTTFAATQVAGVIAP